MTAGQDLAREGQDATLAAATVAHLGYLDDVRAAFETCIEEGWSDDGPWPYSFTAETVRAICEPDTQAWLDDHPNVLPAIFGGAARTNRIRHTGWTRPTRASRHGNTIRTWRGTKERNHDHT